MGFIDFLVGRSVQEVRYGPSLRVVFELGDRVEPALYADLAETFTYVSRTGETVAEVRAAAVLVVVGRSRSASVDCRNGDVGRR